MTDQPPHHCSDGPEARDPVHGPPLIAAFLEQLPLGVGLLDREGRWTLSNAALRSFVGEVLPSRDPEQMQRWRAWDQHGNAIPAKDWPSARALRGETVSQGLEMLYHPPETPPVWTRVRSTPLRSQDGQLMGAITTVEDIDQRKRAEEALRDNERRLRQANDYLELAQIAGSVGFFDYNLEQDASLWTEGMSRLYGIRPEEYDGTWRSWASRVVAEDAERIRREVAAAVRAGAEQVTTEFRAVLPDGSVRWMAGRGRIYYGSHGQPLRLIGVNIDITDLKKAEEKRVASEERLRLATEAARFGVYDTDPVRRTAEWSANLRAMFGVAPEGPVGLEQMLGCLHPEDRDRMRTEYHAILEGRYPDGWKLEFRAICADGQVRWFQDTGRPLSDRRHAVTHVGRLVGVLSDITQRVAQEEALRRSREQLAAELTALQDLHALVTRWAGTSDLQTAMSETLDAVLGLVGTDRGTVQILDETGGGLRLLLARGFAAAALEACALILPGSGSSCALAIEAGQRVTIEDFDADARAAAHADAARALGYRSASSTPLRTIHGTLLGVLTVHFKEPHRLSERELRLMDLYAQHAAHLIEQRQTEQARGESEERFRTMADVSPVIIWVTDTRGGIEFINQAFRNFCGVTDEDVRARRWRLIVHPDDRERYVGGFLRCVREHRPFEGRCRIKRADGEWRWIASYAAPRFSQEGEYLGHVGSSPDIHDLMTAQQSLQASEERLRLAMAGGEMGAWQIELATGEILWDARQSEIFGIDPERPPRTIEEFYARLHPEDQDRIRHAAALTETTGRFAEEFRVIHPGRGLRWVAGLGVLVRDQTGRSVRMVGVNFDVTERREAQARVERFAEELNRQVEARTRELVASQERLRALATELNLAEQRERKRLAAELHDHLQQTLVLGKLKVGQGKRAAHDRPALAEVMDEVDEVLSEALNYTRTLVAELSPPVLRDHGLAAGLHWLAQYMKKRDMTVTVRADGAEDIQLPEEQALLLFQSVRELLINSSKHAGTGEAAVTVERLDGRLRIDVCDAGAGFDLGAVSRDGSPESGAGLSSKFGLFSIDERMRALGGAFEITSSPGQGTAATLILPLQPRRDSGRKPTRVPAPDRRQPDPVHDPTASPLVRVLLADDHTMVRQGLRSLLESYADVEVVGEAWDGQEAVTAVERLHPTVVVMDINMPKKNGIEATAEITSRYPGVTVIGLSVNAEGDSQVAMLNAGAATLLTKEAAVEHLYDAIQEAVHR